MSTVNQEERIKSLESENQQLQQWVNDLQSGMYINCVYCGHRYGKQGEVPESMADILKQHIETCPKHPMSQLKAENADLRRWKEEATAVMPDFQAIGKSLSVQLGKSVSEQILPGIEALKTEISRLREQLQAAQPPAAEASKGTSFSVALEEALSKYWYDTEYSKIDKTNFKECEESRLTFRKWLDENLRSFTDPKEKEK